MLYAMNAQRTIISMKAAPRFFMPKKRTDHRMLSKSCRPKTPSAFLPLSLNFSFSQMKYAEMPISMKSVVQTGANNQLGGTNAGFAREAYQTGMLGTVKNEPITPAALQIMTENRSFDQLSTFITNIIGSRLKYVMAEDDILKKLESMGNQKNIEGAKRYGIDGARMLGISVYDLKKMAKDMKRDHDVAIALWESGIHEARMLAAFTDEIDKVTEKQMEKWAHDFDSWDICDQTCAYLFDKTPWAYEKAFEWSKRDEEFVKRAGFVLMAALAVHDKKADDSRFEQFFPVIKREAHDERNFVKKAVNWALRQIGKRNIELNRKAIKLGEQIDKIDSRAVRWIAKDALRELRSEKTQERLKKT